MSPLVLKLRHGAQLTANDEKALGAFEEITSEIARGDISEDESEPKYIVLVISGWVCRYKQLDDGGRQITAVYLPGDLCEPFGAASPTLDHTLRALTPCVIARVPVSKIRAAASFSPRIDRALWWDLLVSDAIGREHMVGLGRRNAPARLAHFFCELHHRLNMVELAEWRSFEMPIPQYDLADYCGLSDVHVSRSIQMLRNEGLLSLDGGKLTLLDHRGLRSLTGFNKYYLTLQR